MKANDIIAELGELGLYVVTDWPNPTTPCAVAAYHEPRPEDETEEAVHRGDPVAEASGNSYEDALAALHQKVSN